MKNALRWLAVLPLGLLAAVAATIPLHLALRTTLDFIEPYPELPERVLAPFVIGLVFVWVGARIAPSRRPETALVLFGLWVLGLGATVAFVLMGGNIGGRQLFFHGQGLAPAMAFVGGIVGGIAVWRSASRDLTAEDGQRIRETVSAIRADAVGRGSLLTPNDLHDPRMLELLDELALGLLAKGLRDPAGLSKALYRAVKPYFEDTLTERQVRDAFSGYQDSLEQHAALGTEPGVDASSPRNS